MDTQAQTTTSSAFAEDTLDIIIEDKFMRAALIDAAMNMEKMLEAGKVVLEQTYPVKTKWGLEIHITMTQPKANKPVVHKYAYRVNRADFQRWVTEHAYLNEGPHALGFQSRGLTVFIPGPGVTKYDKTTFVVTAKQVDGGVHDDDLQLDLLNETVEFVIHREVVSEHDWIVKTHIK